MRNDLCDFNDVYIVVTGKITATNPVNNNEYNRKVVLKNSAPIFNCTLKINNKLIEDPQNRDIVMLMYNLLYYSKNFRKTTGSSWNYYPDKPKSRYSLRPPAGLTSVRCELEKIFYSIKDSESFNYKIKLVGNVPAAADVANNDVESELEDIKLILPLKNLSNFIFNLDFLLINSEIELSRLFFFGFSK